MSVASSAHSKEAVSRFIERVTAARITPGDPAPRPTRTARQRQREHRTGRQSLESPVGLTPMSIECPHGPAAARAHLKPLPEIPPYRRVSL